MFKNDVELAKERVERYTRKQEEIESRIESIKNGSDKAIHSMNLEAQEAAKDSKTNLENIKTSEDKLKREHLDLGGVVDEMKDLMTRIEKGLTKENHVCVTHMLEANQAINNFAQHSVSATGTVQNASVKWADRTNELIDLGRYIQDAETFKEQEKLMYKFQKMVKSDSIPAWTFIRESRPPMTLVPNYVGCQMFKATHDTSFAPLNSGANTDTLSLQS